MSTPGTHLGPRCTEECTHVSEPGCEPDLFNMSAPNADNYKGRWNLLCANCKLLSKIGEKAILEDDQLRGKLMETWKTKNANMIRQYVYRKYVSQATPRILEISREVQPMEKKETFEAFQHPYEGDSPDLLLSILDDYRRDNKPDETYNYSISMVQSSGTGKSRLVELIAQKRFTLLFNLREDVEQGEYTYPPPDIDVRVFFGEPGSDHNRTLKFAAFLTEVFEAALRFVEDTSTAVSQSPNLRWYDHLREGATTDAPGFKRSEVYKNAVQSAKKAPTNNFLSDADAEADAQKKLLNAGQKLARAIDGALAAPFAKSESLVDDASKSDFLANSASNSNSSTSYASNSGVQLVLVFDEAHTLTKSPNLDGLTSRSPYAILSRVLTFLNQCPLFTIFLSTNSNLQALAPSADRHPSLRARGGDRLFPPFVELPFDVFMDFSGPMTLYDACSAKTVLKFGRPMWWTLFRQNDDERASIERVRSLAIAKLKPAKKEDSESKRDAMIACLSIRLMMDFGSSVQVLRLQSRLVESHMRIVFSIPEHQQHTHTGTPSEPILAEAAASYMASDPGEVVPTLAYLFQNGFLAQGERGELVTRLLWIQAYDRALRTAAEGHHRASPPATDQWHFKYIRPVAVIDFLKALFHPDWHDTVLNARSVGSRKDEPPGQTFREAFQGAHLNFSHFVRAGDFEVIRHDHLYKFLLRHCAVQCRDNQQGIDGGAPLHWGPKTPIGHENTSSVQHQTKDREQGNFFLISPTLFQTTATEARPTLAIFHDHGIKNKKTHGVSIHHETSIGTRSGRRLYERHYQINVAGMGSNIYGVIEQQDEQYYNMLLSLNKLAIDFPRYKNKRALEAFESLKPSITSKPGPVKWDEAGMDTSS